MFAEIFYKSMYKGICTVSLTFLTYVRFMDSISEIAIVRERDKIKIRNKGGEGSGNLTEGTSSILYSSRLCRVVMIFHTSRGRNPFLNRTDR